MRSIRRLFYGLFRPSCRIVLPATRLVVAAAADHDEDKDDPDDPVAVVFTAAIEKAAHR